MPYTFDWLLQQFLHLLHRLRVSRSSKHELLSIMKKGERVKECCEFSFRNWGTAQKLTPSTSVNDDFSSSLLLLSGSFTKDYIECDQRTLTATHVLFAFIYGRSHHSSNQQQNTQNLPPHLDREDQRQRRTLALVFAIHLHPTVETAGTKRNSDSGCESPKLESTKSLKQLDN